MDTFKNSKHHLPDIIFYSGLFYVVVTDLEGNYIYVNDYFIKRFQSGDNGFENKHITDTIIPEDIEKTIETASLCIQNPDKTFTVDIRKPIGQTGEYMKSRWEFSLIINQQNAPLGIMSVGFDIGANDTSKKSIFSNFNLTGKIFENSADGFFKMKSDYKITYINKSAQKILNINSNLGQIEAEDYFERSKSMPFGFAIKQAFNKQEIFSFQDHDESLDLYYFGIAIPTSDGVSVLFRDNTKEQKSKIKIQNSENKLKAILDSTPECIILIDKDLRILAFNQVAYHFCLEHNLVKIKEGGDFNDCIFKSMESTFKSEILKAFKGEYSKFEKEILLKGKVSKWFEFTFCPVYDQEKNMIGVSQLIKDISESKNHLEKIENQYQKLKNIAWVQSHEVRKPLANLMGLVQLLVYDRGSLNEKQLEEFYQDILNESEKLDQIIRKISKATEEHLSD